MERGREGGCVRSRDVSRSVDHLPVLGPPVRTVQCTLCTVCTLPVHTSNTQSVCHPPEEHTDVCVASAAHDNHTLTPQLSPDIKNC